MLRTLFFVLLTATAFGQNQGNIWYFGEGFGLDFNTTPPTLLDDGEITAGTACGSENIEGTASIADSSGNLLFYTNGQTIWNREHHPMPNGTGLLGGISSMQAAIIVPKPLSNTSYYVFTTDDFCNDLENGMRYSIVDICEDNGNGDVLNDFKNILLVDTVAEKLSAVRHANGVDYWVLSHGYFSNKFYAFQVTAQGIQPPIISSVGSVHEGGGANNMWRAIGRLKFSPDGSRVAIGAQNNANILEIFDFSALSGEVSNPIDLSTIEGGSNAIEFSPDGTKLFRTSPVSQLDLSAGSGSSSDILASAYEYPNPDLECAIDFQLGPDGKVYMYNCFDNDISVIHNPNEYGASSNAEANMYVMQSDVYVYALTSMIAGYDYTATGICSPDGIVEDGKYQLRINAFPNPSSGQVRIELADMIENGTLMTYNAQGSLVDRTNVTNSNSFDYELPKDYGVYLLRLVDSNGNQGSLTVIKE